MKPYLENDVSFPDILAWDGYTNCKKNRKNKAKICKNCPLGRIANYFEAVKDGKIQTVLYMD